MKSILVPKMIYPSSIISTPVEVINILIFNIGMEMTKLFAYQPYEFGSLKMIDYKSMVKGLRLSWLKEGNFCWNAIIEQIKSISNHPDFYQEHPT